MKKLLFGLIATVMFSLVGNAQASKTNANNNFYQAAMEAMIAKTAAQYDKDSNVFLSNVAKIDGVVLSSYETKLLLEVHSNVALRPGTYNTTTIQNYKDYGSTAIVAGKKSCAWVRALILALEAWCAMNCN